MWELSIEEYNRMAGDSFPAELQYFDSEEAARAFADLIIATNINASIWLTELVEDPESPGDWTDTDNSICLASISLD